jgi:hypothetical protein
LHTAYLYGFSDQALNKYSWAPFISSLLLYAWLGAWVSLRRSRWVANTIKSVAIVSFFGFFLIAIVFSVFEDRAFINAALVLAIFYVFYFAAYCLVALASAYIANKFTK